MLKRNFSENGKIIIRNASGAFLIRALSIVLSFIMMPMYIRFFNNQYVLGLWFTMLSILTWILDLDLGIGNGLRNHLTKVLTHKEFETAKKYVSSAYISTAFLCAFFGVILAITLRLLNWNFILNIEEENVSSKALSISVAIIFGGVLVHLFLKLISSILYALQKSFANNLLLLITNLLMLLGITIIPSSLDNNRNIIVIATIHAIAVAMPLLSISVWIFCFSELKKIRPSTKYFSYKHAKDIMSLGGIFFYAQIIYMLIMSTNEYMITRITSSSHVVEYKIYNSIFVLGSSIFVLVMTPVWSVVTKALAEKEFNWVEQLYKRFMIFAGIGCLGEFLIIPFLQFLVNLWLQTRAICVSIPTALIFAFMGSLMILNSVLSGIANGAGELKTQVIFFTIGAALKVPVAIILCNEIGWVGVVVANAVAMSFYCIVQPFWLIAYLKKKRIQCDYGVAAK